MQKFINLIIWDFKFALRYHIVTVAALVTLLYASVFFVFKEYDLTLVLQLMIFSDPTMLGFMFVGALILFEKNSHVLQAVAVSPVKHWQYIWSKAIVLTIIAVVSSLGMSLAASNFNFNPVYLISSICLTSFIFVFIGIAGVSKVRTFNQYILIIPLYTMPSVLPLLNFFQFTESKILYIVPTQATLNLLDAAFGKATLADIAFSFSYLVGWTIVAFLISRKMFVKHIITQQ